MVAQGTDYLKKVDVVWLLTYKLFKEGFYGMVAHGTNYVKKVDTVWLLTVQITYRLLIWYGCLRYKLLKDG